MLLCTQRPASPSCEQGKGFPVVLQRLLAVQSILMDVPAKIASLPAVRQGAGGSCPARRAASRGSVQGCEMVKRRLCYTGILEQRSSSATPATWRAAKVSPCEGQSRRSGRGGFHGAEEGTEGSKRCGHITSRNAHLIKATNSVI